MIYRNPYSQTLDPKYVISVSVPPHLHAGIVLDHLLQRDLRLLTHLTPAQVHHIMEWESPDALFHISVVSLSAVRAALSDTPRTTAYRDLIEYPRVSLLNDEHMSILANFDNCLLSGGKVEILHFGVLLLHFVILLEAFAMMGLGCALPRGDRLPLLPNARSWRRWLLNVHVYMYWRMSAQCCGRGSPSSGLLLLGPGLCPSCLPWLITFSVRPLAFWRWRRLLGDL